MVELAAYRNRLNLRDQIQWNNLTPRQMKKRDGMFGKAPERGDERRGDNLKFKENLKSVHFGKMAGKKVREKGGKTTYSYS